MHFKIGGKRASLTKMRAKQQRKRLSEKCSDAAIGCTDIATDGAGGSGGPMKAAEFDEKIWDKVKWKQHLR